MCQICALVACGVSQDIWVSPGYHEISTAFTRNLKKHIVRSDVPGTHSWPRWSPGPPGTQGIKCGFYMYIGLLRQKRISFQAKVWTRSVEIRRIRTRECCRLKARTYTIYTSDFDRNPKMFNLIPLNSIQRTWQVHKFHKKNIIFNQTESCRWKAVTIRPTSTEIHKCSIWFH